MINVVMQCMLLPLSGFPATSSTVYNTPTNKSSVIMIQMLILNVAFDALMLLVGWQEEHPACKKYWGMVEVGTG